MTLEMLHKDPDEIALMCRGVGTVAKDGRDALRNLLRRRVSKSSEVTKRHVVVDGKVQHLPLTAMAFINRFNAGYYPEIDNPVQRSQVIERDSVEACGLSLRSAQACLGKSPDAVADRLCRAGCFGETPQESLKAWFDIYVCGDTQVDGGHVHWMGAVVPLAPAVREFVARWDEYPYVHFVIGRQLCAK